MASISDFTNETLRPRKARPSKIQDATRKWCSLCKMYVPCSEFPARKGARDGLASSCRPCLIAKSQTLENRTAAYVRHIKRKYGLEIEEFDALLASQGGGCAVCGGPPNAKNWHIDHDHRSGKVRGILCNGCNTGIGSMRDDPAIMRAAAEYIERCR